MYPLLAPLCCLADMYRTPTRPDDNAALSTPAGKSNTDKAPREDLECYDTHSATRVATATLNTKGCLPEVIDSHHGSQATEAIATPADKVEEPAATAVTETTNQSEHRAIRGSFECCGFKFDFDFGKAVGCFQAKSSRSLCQEIQTRKHQ